jgi:hypothetical protein
LSNVQETNWNTFLQDAKPIAQPKSRLRDTTNFIVVKDEKLSDSVTIYDVLPQLDSSEDAILANFLPMVQEYLKMEEKEDDYVYDIYIGQDVAQETQGRWAHLTWKDEQVYYSASDTTSELSTEDSNAEDYYGNDYPDSDSYSERVQSSQSESGSDW